MLTDRQVVLMRQKLMKGKTQQAAAAASDMSERSVRNWNKGPLPSEKKDRRRKSTRPDPFAGVWAEEVEPLLEADVDRILAAPTVLEWLDERHPGRFNASHLRTLQRRIRDWRALNGPEREVYFEQKHPPGREAQMDFTHCDSLKVTIGGEPFPHMVFEFILSHSGWRYAQICFSETFVALVSGLQGALWELGAAPEVVRSDNLSAATHKLKDGKGRDFNERYKEILDHYGLKATRTNSYSAHENGVAEQGHRRLKDAVAQALVLRGSSDFESVEQYAKFVRSIVDRRNRLVREKLAGEYPHLRALPPAPVPEYVSYTARVLKWSTIRVDSRTYSVPSRLIGVMVDVRLYPDHVEVYYKGHLVESMERIRGKGKARIDYRHIIGSLVRKPGAFARYRFREQLYPTHTFRLAYDAMCGWKGERADVDYVRILHLAATTMECEVERALRRLLESRVRFDYAVVKQLAAPAYPEIPALELPGEVDLGVYDRLLTGGAR